VPDEELLGDLDRAVDALVDVMHAYELPVISGKDSLSSTYRGPKGLAIHIPPVVCVSAMGRIADVSRTVSADFKRVGSSVLLVGQPDFGGMGGSAYFDLHGLPGARPPRVDLETTRRVFEAVHAAVVEGAILACHDISQGGLGTALAEMCFGGEVGADLELAALGDVRPDFAMFNETAGCFLVELADAADGKRLLSGVPCAWLGTTTDRGSICVGRGGDLVCEAHLDDLKAAWQAPMQAVFH
jgi:phosphoribosylformylglycinamidine synthase